ncbi:MAG: sugar transporter ATP-binding protein [Chloroflexi bacterium]|nr:sugar transporter ATP-binding protein [Chloroflexota bacterium]
MDLLTVRDLRKTYGAVVALQSGNLTVAAGEIHALLGANGAGKSTMVKMLTGVIRPDSGTISVGGRAVQLRSPAAAQRAGLAAVFQDPALAPDLTVLENLRLTGTSVSAVQRWLQVMTLAVDLRQLVGDLPLPLLRMLDLARALAREPQLLLLDEITAALPSDLAERVFVVMRQWRDQGRSVLFISHRLAEVRAICDRATVLRDGRDVGVLDLTEGSEERIVELMLGPAAQDVAAGTHAASAKTELRERGAPLLEVRDLQLAQELKGISFTLSRGEVLGVAALEGQGQEALFDCLAGRRTASGGEIVMKGKSLRLRQPYDAIRNGVVLVPADRLLALLPQRSVHENIGLPLYNRLSRWGMIRQSQEREQIQAAVAKLQIDTRAQRQVRWLSGGNQQKVTIARWVASGFDVLLCFDPTRGIDVGTKRQIYRLLQELASQGAAVLLFTSELPEIQLVCDRVIVLYEGKLVRELPAAEADEAALLHAAHGLTRAEAVAL